MAQSTHPQNLKHQILTCFGKLSDRDTHAIAASELQSIARSLQPSFFPTFLSCIHSTSATDKSPVRKQCVHLLAVLSESHGNSLSPHLSKMLSSVIRRLRDPDSAVRSTCINTTAALCMHITTPSFSSLFKPLADALFTEQDLNSQIGAALCLAAAIQASPDPEPGQLLKFVPRFMKLLKSNSFRAKSAVLVLIGSVIEVGGAANKLVLRNLIPCIVEFLSKEDWASRKAAAEAMMKLAMVERDCLGEFKAGCLKVFENRRFDKVKAVRDVMNQLVETWKQVPDVSSEVCPPPKSQTSREDTSDGCCQPGSNILCTAGSDAPHVRKGLAQVSRSTPPESLSVISARKKNYSKSSDRKTTPAMCRKLNSKKPLDCTVENAVSHASGLMRGSDVDLKERDEGVINRTTEKNRFQKRETKRALFYKNFDEKAIKFDDLVSGSHVVACDEERSEIIVVNGDVNKDLHRNHKECEDLSLVSKQLVQIEQQQASLVDLLQRFIGSSEQGMQSLETRVHSLELTLVGISHDLAVTKETMAKTDSSDIRCCLLGEGFLSSKFWRKRDNTISSTISNHDDTASVSARHHRVATKNGKAEPFTLENPKLRLQGGGGFIVNPLAEIHSSLREVSDMAHH